MDQQSGRLKVSVWGLGGLKFQVSEHIEGYRLEVNRNTADWVAVILSGGSLTDFLEASMFLYHGDQREKEMKALLISGLSHEKREGVAEEVARRAIELLAELEPIIRQRTFTLRWSGASAEVIDQITGMPADI